MGIFLRVWVWKGRREKKNGGISKLLITQSSSKTMSTWNSDFNRNKSIIDYLSTQDNDEIKDFLLNVWKTCKNTKYYFWHPFSVGMWVGSTLLFLSPWPKLVVLPFPQDKTFPASICRLKYIIYYMRRRK